MGSLGVRQFKGFDRSRDMPSNLQNSTQKKEYIAKKMSDRQQTHPL